MDRWHQPQRRPRLHARSGRRFWSRSRCPLRDVHLCSGLPAPLPDAEAQQMFPDGNATFARLITKTLLPDSIAGDLTPRRCLPERRQLRRARSPGSSSRIRLRSRRSGCSMMAIHGRHRRDGGLYDGGRLHRARARSVVMAGGSWTTRQIVRDFLRREREAYSSSIDRRL